MTVRQQWFTVLGIVLALLSAIGAGAYVMRDELFPIEVGSRAPSFTARSVDGENRIRQLEDYAGKVVVLNVWATWCPPCVREMPTFEKLHQTFPSSDLRIVAVSVDELVGADSVRKYAEGLGVTFEVLLDSTRGIDRTYQVTGYPETFVIARDGTIRKKWIGEANWASDANIALIRGLLEK
jgi:cytochrome c biogenesis protein CcmG, thiol:disulfide interchange protein DsbE